MLVNGAPVHMYSTEYEYGCANHLSLPPIIECHLG